VRHNNKAPLLLSRLTTDQIEIVPGAPALMICQNCDTWRQLKRHMVPPHRMEDRGHGLPNRRCDGSGQRVVFDVDVKTWLARQDRLMPDALQPQTRRSARQFFKPLPPVTPAAQQLARAEMTLASARETYFAHRTGCAACTGRKVCNDGGRLAAEYVRLLQREPQRQADRARLEQAQARRELVDAGLRAVVRAEQWAAVLPSIERADRLRDAAPMGSTVLGPIRAPEVPAETLHPVA
jgi:hypothetical protein